jgi:hypothetical protein
MIWPRFYFSVIRKNYLGNQVATKRGRLEPFGAARLTFMKLHTLTCRSDTYSCFSFEERFSPKCRKIRYGP